MIIKCIEACAYGAAIASIISSLFFTFTVGGKIVQGMQGLASVEISKALIIACYYITKIGAEMSALLWTLLFFARS